MKYMKFITGLFSSFLLLVKLTTLSANAEEMEEITEFPTEPEILTQDYDGQTILLPLAEHAEELEMNIVYDENGNAYILHDGKRVTGKFYLVPEYSKGDILQDDTINAEDASDILYAAATAGANGIDTTEVLLNQQENYSTNYQILQLADVNNDNIINAADAAEILSYASAYGSGQNPLALGITCYQTDENGVLQKGWLDEVHYADENYQLQTGWTEIDGFTYYFNAEYAKQTGLVTIYSENYYFSESGIMQTGWINAENGRMYFSEDGRQETGLQQIENQMYYFDSDGIMQTGFVTIHSENYYFSESGIMQIGWMDAENGRMYFSEDGRQKTGLQQIENQMYYFDSDGIMQTGWIDAENGRMYFSENGIQEIGWQEIEEKTYYFDSDGMMQTGLVQIDDKMYRFQTDGIYHPLKICLDAGHYGSLYNKSPVNAAYYESNFTWNMHLHLKTALENYGFEVITTRETKEDNTALVLRGEMSKGCVLFLSIHSNACGSSSVDAPLACCQISGVADMLGLQLANKIHEVMGTKQAGTIWKRPGTNTKNKGGDWYNVLYGAANVGTMGILLEHSYHTNLRSTNWLLIDDNLKILADAEAQVISDYFGFS